jgi:uncharacterized membrane protein
MRFAKQDPYYVRNRKSPKMEGKDITMEVVSAVFLIICIVFTILYWGDLPQEVPTRFDENGVPISFGGKWQASFLLVVITGLYIALTIISRMPHIYNYPVTINAQNEAVQNKLAVSMFRLVKLEIVLFFGSIYMKQFKSIITATRLESTYVVIAGIVVVLTMVAYINKAKKIEKIRLISEQVTNRQRTTKHILAERKAREMKESREMEGASVDEADTQTDN